MQKEKDREAEEARNREKELMKRITELQNEITNLKGEVKELSSKLAGKDFEIKTMQDRVQEVEVLMKEEKKKCKERIQEIENEFNLKEKTLLDKLKKDMN